MLKKLIHPSAEKIKTAHKVYETYCKCNSLRATSKATGLAVNTIIKYIALAEDINNINKISERDSYYNPDDVDKSDNLDNLDNDKTDIEIITPENVPSLKEVKNKILLGKLDSISAKYLDYLENPSDRQLLKTSLKDKAVIAGIALDKKILLEHKQADVIKNQSIIFNLFGNNANLANFITDSQARQKKLKDRPLKKYVPGVSKLMVLFQPIFSFKNYPEKYRG